MYRVSTAPSHCVEASTDTPEAFDASATSSETIQNALTRGIQKSGMEAVGSHVDAAKSCLRRHRATAM